MSKKSIYNYIWSFLEQGGSKFIAIIVQIILARILAPEIFGLMAIVLVVVNICSSVAQNGIAAALIQYDSADEKVYSTAFWISLLFSAALYLVAFFVAPLMALLYDNPELSLYIRILSLVVIIGALTSVQRASFQRELRFRKLCIIGIVSALISGVIAVICVFACPGIWTLIIYTIAQSLISCMLFYAASAWRPSFCFMRKEVKELFAFGANICVINLLSSLCSGVPDLILGKTTSRSELGFYSQGRKWPTTIMGALSTSIENVIYPMFASIKDDSDAFKATFVNHMRKGSLLVMPFCALAAVCAEPLTLILLTEKWLPSVLIFQMASLSFVFVIPQAMNLRGYLAQGEAALYRRISALRILLELTILSALAYFTGNIYLTAIGILACKTLGVVFIEMHPAKKHLGIGRIDQLKIIFPILGASLLSAILPWTVSMLGLIPIVELLFQIGLYIVCYLLALKLFKIGDLSDILRLLKRKN